MIQHQKDKLTMALELQEELRQKKAMTVSVDDLVKRYGVTVSTAYAIIRELERLCSMDAQCCAKKLRGATLFVNLGGLDE